MARRPPADPLPRGLIWRVARVGMSVGDPLAELAYVTPNHPDGLRQSRLKLASPTEQAETAIFWFLSNYEPFVSSRWAGFGPSYGSFGSPFAPEYWPVGVLLNEEFEGLISETVLHELAYNLEAQAPFWILITDPPQILLKIASKNATLQDILETLNRLENAVSKLTAVHGGMGHNQGPAILDELSQADIGEAVKEARIGIREGKQGSTKVQDAQSRLTKTFNKVGENLLAGLAKKAGEDAFNPASFAARLLFHYLNEAIAALAHWLTTIF